MFLKQEMVTQSEWIGNKIYIKLIFKPKPAVNRNI